jgi:N-acetylmuramoyl-L-alanine amidase
MRGGRHARGALLLLALGSWAVAATGARAAAAPAEEVRPLPVRTSLDAGVEYLDVNDLLRAVGGAREMLDGIGMARLHAFGAVLSVLDGSRLVEAGDRRWLLPAPVRFRKGQVWVPRAFVGQVMGDLAPDPLTYAAGRLFVGVEPGSIASVSIEPVFEGREITISGRFPGRPGISTRRGEIEVRLTGCLSGGASFESEDDLVTDVTLREREDGVALAFALDEAVTGYTWRERSRDRIRILVGDAPRGLVPLEAAPGVTTRRLSRIVIDPARGGVELGAAVGNVREKWLTLELARVVADSLLAAGYDVVLTRNEDRDLTPEERAEIANGWPADVFVSLAFDANPSTTAPDVCGVVHRSIGDAGEARVAAGYRLTPWAHAQDAHVAESVALAGWLGRLAPGGSPAVEPIRVPSRLLQGLEMPAVEVLIASDVAERGPWRFWRERFAGTLVRALASFSGREELPRPPGEPRRARRFR